MRNLPAAKWEGQPGPGWPSGVDGGGWRGKSSKQRRLRLGSGAPFLVKGYQLCAQP